MSLLQVSAFVGPRRLCSRELSKGGLRHQHPSRALSFHNVQNRMAPTQDGSGHPSPKRQLALSWSEEDIISVFKQTRRFKPNGCDVTGSVFPTEQPVAYVKIGLIPDLMAEVRNHKYAFKALRDMPPNQARGILIPEIYRTFENGERLFIVM